MISGVNSYAVEPSFPSLINLRDAFQPFTKKPMKREMIVPHRHGGSLGVRVCDIRGRVYITYVWPDSVAWRIGLNPGDRIETVNGEGISDPKVFVLKFKETDGPVTLALVDCPSERVRIHSSAKTQLGIVYSDWRVQEVLEGGAAYDSKIQQLKDTHSIVAINDKVTVNWTDDQVNIEMKHAWEETRDLKLTFVPFEIAYEMAVAVRELRAGKAS